MKTTKVLAGSAIVASFLAFGRGAAAQASPGPFGLGAEVTTTGIAGALFVYDPGNFHIDVIAGADFYHNGSTVEAAGRFFFPVSRGHGADFSIGPGIGFEHIDYPPGTDPNAPTNRVHLEGAFQIRAFVVPNVAVEASAGLGTVIANGNDNNSFHFGGEVGGQFGIVYFF